MRRLRRKFRRYMDRNWMYILIGLWLTAKSVDSAYQFRGYRAVGSEYLVLPMFLIAVEMLRKAIRFAKSCREEA